MSHQMCVYGLTFCCAIHIIASWQLLPGSSQPPELPLVLLLLCMVPVMAMWTPLSWSLHISKLQIRKRERTFGETCMFIILVRYRILKKGKSEEEEREKSSSRPDYILIRLSQLSQVHGTVLQLLNGLFSHRHVALCITLGTALQCINKIISCTKYQNIHSLPVKGFWLR